MIRLVNSSASHLAIRDYRRTHRYLPGEMFSLLLLVSQCSATFDVSTAGLSILAVGFVARCYSVVISSRRGSSLPGRGMGAQGMQSSLAPPSLDLAVVSACREEIATAPNLIS